MKKYGSGYAFLSVIETLGSLIIVLSFFPAIAAWDMSGKAWVAVLVFSAVGFQGLVLMGLSKIGLAILDGSSAQQKLQEDFKAYLDQKQKAPPRSEPNPGTEKSVSIKSENAKTQLREPVQRALPVNSGDVYLGKTIKRSLEGYEIVGEPQIFETLLRAKTWIEDQQRNNRT